VIDGARDGGDGDAGALCDVPDAHRSGTTAFAGVVFWSAHVEAILHPFSRVSR
jgi:hypothetical protein